MLVFEYAEEGDLRHVMASRIEEGKPFTEPELLRYLCMIGFGLNYLHQKRVAHCDIKPENIFLSQGGIVKLGDFGLV